MRLLDSTVSDSLVADSVRCLARTSALLVVCWLARSLSIRIRNLAAAGELPSCSTGSRFLGSRLIASIAFAGITNWNWTYAQDEVPRADAIPSMTVVVKVMDEDDQPIEGAEVELLEWTGRYESFGAAATTDRSGQATIELTAVDHSFYLRVMAENFATTMRPVQLETANEFQFEVKLSVPANSWMEIVSETGEPIAGAEIGRIDFVDAGGQKNAITSRTADAYNYALVPSDAQGKLVLPPVPAGANISVWIYHPEWRVGIVKDAVVSSGNIARLELKSGIPVTLQFATDDGAVIKDGTRARILMIPRVEGSSTADTVQHEFVIQNSSLLFTATPIEYELLRVDMEDYFVAPPIVNRLNAPNALLDLRSTASQQIELLAKKKLEAKGRVIDGNGKPMAGVWVSAVIQVGDATSDSDESTDSIAKLQSEWVAAGNAVTDAMGVYDIEVAAGRIFVKSLHKKYFPASGAGVYFDASREGNLQVPDIRLLPVPTIRGFVRDAAGNPVVNAIVRLRHVGRGDADPVDSTSIDGSFRLELSRIPYRRDRIGLQTEVHVLAFQPETGLAGISTLDLGDTAAVENVIVEMEPRDPSWPLDVVDVPNTYSHGTGAAKWQELMEQRRQEFPGAVPGNPFPSLSEGTWLNTDASSLEDFKGKYVLLDFWFIGCGPCERDFPSVKLAHQRFYNLGFTVVGVHIQGQQPEDVQQFARSRGMNYPIVVDDQQGSITKQIRELGVSSYPTYILLDPDGHILVHDHLLEAGESSLRIQKLERIYEILLSHVRVGR